MEQLERIRKQNYQERKNLQNKKPVMYEPSNPVSNRADEAPNYGVNDPRYDPAARRQKIAALKVAFNNHFCFLMCYYFSP